MEVIGSINGLNYNIPTTSKQSRDALGHILSNMIKLKSDSPICKVLTHNDCEYIEGPFAINGEDIPYICYPKNTKTLVFISKGQKD